MLKENIAYGFEYEDKLGIMIGNSNTIKDLIKSYMLLGIKYKKDNFDYIVYRGHSIIINDEKGIKDAFTLEQEIKYQVNEINKLEDGD